jgi:hypothetical protein
MHSEGDVSINADCVRKLVLLDSLLLSNLAVAKQRTEENIWTRLREGKRRDENYTVIEFVFSRSQWPRGL